MPDTPAQTPWPALPHFRLLHDAATLLSHLTGAQSTAADLATAVEPDPTGARMVMDDGHVFAGADATRVDELHAALQAAQRLTTEAHAAALEASRVLAALVAERAEWATPDDDPPTA